MRRVRAGLLGGVPGISPRDVKVGEIVTAHGTVGTNRDLGAGYHYDVLVESATLTR